MSGVADRKGGALAGLKVVEMAGLGPVPLAGLILSEMGADVLRIERIEPAKPFLDQKPEFNLDIHGRKILAVDLKSRMGKEVVLRLAEKSDVLMEGFRPGVMERLGLGPEPCCTRNPRLVYARMTGFGQEGPLAASAGHDLTYIAYTGILDAIGPKGGRPVPPLNLVADYGGGTMFVIAGILAALLERSTSGKGQIIDAAMIDGSSMLAAPYYGFIASGIWGSGRGTNLLDSGAPFYDTYETADRRYIAIACLEPQFFTEFIRLSGLPEDFVARQYDRNSWPDLRAAIETRIKEKTRDEWAGIFEMSDACVAPVLDFSEAPHHPHNMARQTHARNGRFLRPSPAPRFSRTHSALSGPPAPAALDPQTILAEFGFTEFEIGDLCRSGTVGNSVRTS
jgi:alpha-methylacyl-CoA racemase